MRKPKIALSCPFCGRDAGFCTLTKQGRPTFHCNVCKTRAFFNDSAAVTGFGDLAGEVDDLMEMLRREAHGDEG